MSDILVLGMAVADFVFSVERFPTEAKKYRADGAAVVGGGIAANAAVAIARLGGTPHFVGRLGDDPLAGMILEELEAEGVDTRFVHRAEGGHSMFSSVLVDAAGERQIVNFRGDGLTEDTNWIAEAPEAKAVLVDTRWPDGASVALDIARERGVPGIVDGEAPIDTRLLEKASHLALSAQGLRDQVEATDLALGLEQFADRVPGWACVTDGEKGVWYTTQSGIAHVPAFQVEAVDTLAAGDVWHGAFALALAEGQSERDAIRFASASAALKCTKFGGRLGTPDRAAVLTFLKEYE